MLKGYPLCSGVVYSVSALWSRYFDEVMSAVVCIRKKHCFYLGRCSLVAVGAVLQCAVWSLWWMANLCTVGYGLSPRASPRVGSTGRSQGLMGSLISPRDPQHPTGGSSDVGAVSCLPGLPKAKCDGLLPHPLSASLFLWVSLIYRVLRLHQELTSTGTLKYPSLAMWTRAN